MARRKIITETTEVDINPPTQIPLPGTEPETVPETKDELDLNRFMNSFGADGAKIRIYRVDHNGSLVFVSVCPLEIISEEHLQENYGAGKYEIRLFDSNNKYVVSRRLNVAGMPGSDGKPIPLPSQILVPAMPGSQAPDAYQMQLEMLRSELSANREMMLELIRNMTKSENSGSTLSEFAAAMSAIKDTLKPAETQNPLAMIGDIIGVLKQGIELGASGGMPNKKEGWMEVIKEVVAAIPSVASAIRPASPAPIQNSPPEEIPENGHNPMNLPPQLLTQVRYGIEYLKTRCRMNKDPELWVDVILENLDQDHYIQIARMASSMNIEQFAEMLGDKDLIAAPFRPWFEKVLTGVKNALAEREPEAGSGSDIPDASGNGPADKKLSG